MSQPPALPPRSPSIASTFSSSSDDGRWSPPRYAQSRVNTVHLTPHTRYSESGERQNNPYGGGTGLDDPRSSSTQSLRPVESAGGRRKLLIVYIHGFMGTETSFRSFPAHVHNLLTATMADTHVVHTKIYPRYQSRKNISYARDDFSNWLTPHESDDTDVILIGHSLGGILAAEVVLLPSHRPGSKDVFQHRILGHIAYDTPFLGMHPGVVSTGIASLFKSKPGPPQEPEPGQQSNTTSLSINPFEVEPSDPNYNPAFPNDVKMTSRSGTFDRAFYFLNKHYGDWRKATANYVKSHLEFGGCLADYDGLKKRYRSFRPLEDVDDLGTSTTKNGRRIPRVRFVNYYTASTGRIKQQQPEDSQKVLVAETEMTDRRRPSNAIVGGTSSGQLTPRISLDEHRDDEVISKDVEELHLDDSEDGQMHSDMQFLDPQAEPPSPVLEAVDTTTTRSGHQDLVDPSPMTPIGSQMSLTTSLDTASITSSQIRTDSLPPLPEPPKAPAPFDPTPYTTGDPSTLKLAQKEHERLRKSYERSKKDYEKMVREREKHLAKLEKLRKQQEEKAAKEKANAGLSAHEISERERLRKEEERMQREKDRMEGKDRTEQISEDFKRSATLNQAQYDEAVARQKQEAEDAAEIARQIDIDRAAASSKKAEKEKDRQKQKAAKPQPPKKQKDRKFCTLPKKDAGTGQRDATWIRVYMENMDEVVAHTSLFFVSETYAKLVGDTAERIEKWIRDDATIRAVREAQEWERGGK